MEETTKQEIIHDLANTNSVDLSWIPVLGVIISIGILSFAIYSLTRTQKQHALEQKRLTNLEFIKQLEFYQKEFTNMWDIFKKTNNDYINCRLYAKTWLRLLDRIAYLKIIGLVNQDFIQFFQNEFNLGRTKFAWLEFTNIRPDSWPDIYPNFYKIRNSIEYTGQQVAIASPFYYFSSKMNEDRNYDPKLDKFETGKFTATQKDIDLIKPS